MHRAHRARAAAASVARRPGSRRTARARRALRVRRDCGSSGTVGQLAPAQARAFAAAEVQLAASSAASFTSTSALPPRCAGCGAALTTMPAGCAGSRCGTRPARRRRRVAVEQEHAALDRAAVLAARDDLLARIAALLEVDAADELEIDHLRHELLDRRGLDRGMPLCTSSQRQVVERERAARRRRRPRCRRRRTSSARGRRRRAGGSALRRPRRACSTTRRVAPSQRGAARRRGRAARTSALASLSLHFARSTNIDRRFSVGASRSALQASRISSAPRCQTTKLACSRPLAEQKPASRASPRRARRRRWSAGPAGTARRRRRARGSRPDAARRHDAVERELGLHGADYHQRP